MPDNRSRCAWLGFEVVRTQPERVAEIHRIPGGVTIQIQASGQANGVFLRETPDRREIVDTERRKHAPLFFLAARMSQRLVVKRGLDPDAHFRGGVVYFACGGESDGGRCIGARLQSRAPRSGPARYTETPRPQLNTTLGYVQSLSPSGRGPVRIMGPLCAPSAARGRAGGSRSGEQLPSGPLWGSRACWHFSVSARCLRKRVQYPPARPRER